MQKSSAGKFHRVPPSLAYLLDHLVGAGEQRRRHVDAQHLRGLEVDYQFELGWLLHWQGRRLDALKNAAGIAANTTINVRNAGSVAHQPASFRHVTPT